VAELLLREVLRALGAFGVSLGDALRAISEFI